MDEKLNNLILFPRTFGYYWKFLTPRAAIINMKRKCSKVYADNPFTWGTYKHNPLMTKEKALLKLIVAVDEDDEVLPYYSSYTFNDLLALANPLNIPYEGCHRLIAINEN